MLLGTSVKTTTQALIRVMSIWITQITLASAWRRDRHGNEEWPVRRHRHGSSGRKAKRMGVQPASEAESKDLLTWPAGAGERNMDSHRRRWCQLLRRGNRVAGTGYDIIFLRYLERIQEAISTRQFNIQAWSSKRRSVLRHKPVTRAGRQLACTNAALPAVHPFSTVGQCPCHFQVFLWRYWRGWVSFSLTLSVTSPLWLSALSHPIPNSFCLSHSFLSSPLFIYLSVTLFYSFCRDIHVKPAFSPSCLRTLLKFLHPVLSPSSVSHLFSLPSFFHPYLGWFLSPSLTVSLLSSFKNTSFNLLECVNQLHFSFLILVLESKWVECL